MTDTVRDAATPRSAASSTALVAEALGTFFFVLVLISAALFSAGAPETGAGTLGPMGIALAGGLAVSGGYAAFARVSGGHFNPAVTVGLAAAGRFPWRRVPAYAIAQIVGASVATTVVVLVGLFGADGWLARVQDAGFASNGFGGQSPAGFAIGGAIIVQTLFTAVLVLVFLGATRRRRGNPSITGLVVGLTVTAIYLATIPVDNGGVNPARSIATAIYGGFDALAQLWVFLVFPLLGALNAGYAFRPLLGDATRG